MARSHEFVVLRGGSFDICSEKLVVLAQGVVPRRASLGSIDIVVAVDEAGLVEILAQQIFGSCSIDIVNV